MPRLRLPPMFLLLIGLVLPSPLLHAAEPATRPIPPAFGPYVDLKDEDFAGVPSFKAQDRIVGTYYFYWYDSRTRGHLINGDGSDALTTHPASLEDFSYKSVAWHRRQLEDMIYAGIDVVLPVFWGAPSEHEGEHWSYAGLPPLVKAREELLREGKNPPRIGLFYDTSTLQYNRWNVHVDCTTDYGREWFYATICDFFSMIPPKHWAMIDGKPIVLLYSAAFAKKHDQSVIDHTRQRFAAEFAGRVPWIAREISWQVKADDTVAWGGALGLKNPGVASVGPGYDHSAVPGRTPLVVDRRNGKFYEENWLKLLRRPSKFVMIETWSEFHEGTDIAESREYGRQYLDLTRKYTALFKQGFTPPWPKGSYSDAAQLTVQLGEKNRSAGLTPVENEDGTTTVVTVAGREARVLAPSKVHNNSYMYFAVDDSFKNAPTMQLILAVDYYDAAPGTLSVEFDGSDANAPFGGAYTSSRDSVKLEGSKTWKTARFTLPDARLLNSQNRSADLRLVIQSPGLAISRVTLRKN
ncbi:MAG: DUF5010 domain-containing protein [Tepidisphaerales bacterium]